MTTHQTIKEFINQKFDPISQKIDNLSNLKDENIMETEKKLFYEYMNKIRRNANMTEYINPECENVNCDKEAMVELYELERTGDHFYCIDCAILRLSELREQDTPLRKIGRKVGVTSVVGIR